MPYQQRGALGAVETEGVICRQVTAGADPDLEPTAAHQVEYRGVLRRAGCDLETVGPRRAEITLSSGRVLNGIQCHQDMFTTLAAAAGVENVVDKVRKEKKQLLDGVDNLAYWKGDAPRSARNHVFHYYESKLMAVRMGPWKFHFSTKEEVMAAVRAGGTERPRKPPGVL